MTDFTLENHGSICILKPHTPEADSWIEESISEEHQCWGTGIVIEPRYVGAILEGIAASGLTSGGDRSLEG